jgi:glycerol-3-phosphate dehydrogenase (NAD(P)+)
VTLLAHSANTAARIASTLRNEPRLPGIDLPRSVIATADVASLASADLVVFAVPSAHLRSESSRVASSIAPEADLLSVVKGLESGTLLRMSEVIADAGGFARARIAALSGPNLAQEIARGLPASAVVAAGDKELASRVVARVGTKRFRLYVNADILGVELCGALKNVLAIAAGAVDQLGWGDNGKAGLITRGLAEMSRLGMAMGANPLTFAGLAGVGDVVATSGSRLSRNHRLGEELAKGRAWADIEATLPGVAEGAYTVDAALALARRYEVEMPIADQVHQALFEGKSVRRCLFDLLARESKDELADFRRWADTLVLERRVARPGALGRASGSAGPPRVRDVHVTEPREHPAGGATSMSTITEAEIRRHIDAMGRGDAATLSEILADDFVQDWPQTGERVRGRDACLNVARNYPGGQPVIEVQRVTGEGDHWTVESTMRYADGSTYHAASILELHDGKVTHQTDYFGPPYPAPEWRAQWVERVELANA